jgi:hypothetical protein
MQIVLVSAGNFQEWIIDNIKNLQLFGNKNITVITESAFFDRLEEFGVELVDASTLDDLSFNTKSTLDREFRDGFWHYCSLRFYLLHSYMLKTNTKDVIHLENDCMMYINVNELDGKFNQNKVYATFDNPRRVVPGIMYIPSHEALLSILQNYHPGLNDMANLGRMRGDLIEALPILPIQDNLKHMYNKLFGEFECIFDAAAMGQYVGGLDKLFGTHDTRGYISNDCVVKYNLYKFVWIQNDQKLNVPHLVYDDNVSVPIVNLHIHSKELFRFMADNPLEQEYIQLV